MNFDLNPHIPEYGAPAIGMPELRQSIANISLALSSGVITPHEAIQRMKAIEYVLTMRSQALTALLESVQGHIDNLKVSVK